MFLDELGSSNILKREPCSVWRWRRGGVGQEGRRPGGGLVMSGDGGDEHLWLGGPPLWGGR